MIDHAFIAALRTFVGWDKLSPREVEVLDARVRGERHIASALRLGLAVGTFETHQTRAMEKLGYEGNTRSLERDLLIAYGRALEREPTSRVHG